ncbi:hypothetical protein DQ04_11701010 [Trypanosoma grayi]|uniref:hypothetical protein n=1 Tax=Trypanosoma grayi TaxID=71804 RepID=UPI0004F3FD7F|nr:hypothetical protein DQ04_11701010 [Trypanosoma grayi]KEG06903.1 hypothetical protein DQ04_11701010 [Trypanosoma grayi]
MDAHQRHTAPQQRSQPPPKGRHADSTAPSAYSADEAPLTAQLKVLLYRIYTGVSRQREWFRQHEANAMSLAKEADVLRERFFPQEPSLLDAIQKDIADITAGSAAATAPLSSGGFSSTGEGMGKCAASPLLGQQEGSQHMVALSAATLQRWHPSLLHTVAEGPRLHTIATPGPHNVNDACAYSVAAPDPALSGDCGRSDIADVQRVVPAYLLQLTPSWIHARLGGEAVATEEAMTALVALLLPLLRALHGVVRMTRWRVPVGLTSDVGAHDGAVTFDVLRAVARHLFYLLHESLCCLSLRTAAAAAASPAGPPAAPPQLSCAERVEATQIVASLLSGVDNSGVLLQQLLCTDDADDAGSVTCYHNASTTVAVPQSVVGEAFDFLIIHYLGMGVGS